MKPRYRYPAALRDLAEDCDYWHKLTPEEAWWNRRFRAEYYCAHRRGEPIHTDAQLRGQNKWKQRAMVDAAPWMDEPCGNWGVTQPSDVVDTQLETSEVRIILSRLRKLRPEPPDGDQRRKPVFKSELEKRLFHALQRKLKRILGQ